MSFLSHLQFFLIILICAFDQTYSNLNVNVFQDTSLQSKSEEILYNNYVKSAKMQSETETVTDLNSFCCNCRFSMDIFNEICLGPNVSTTNMESKWIFQTQNSTEDQIFSVHLMKIVNSSDKVSIKRKLKWICCKKNILELFGHFAKSKTTWMLKLNDLICSQNYNVNSSEFEFSSKLSEEIPTPQFCNPFMIIEPKLDLVLICLTISSIVLLALTSLTYIYLPSLLNIHGKTIVCHLICLMISYIFQTVQYFIQPEIQKLGEYERPFYCFPVGIGFYLTSLCALFWLCIINIDIWHTFTSKFAEDKTDAKKRFRKYCIAGFGIPLSLTCLVLLLELTLPNDNPCKPGIGVHTTRCFFSTSSGYAIVIYYYGITALMITINLAVFARTNVVLCQIQSSVAHVKKSSTAVKNNSERFILFFKLFCVMGISWIINIVLWSIGYDQLSLEEASWTARFFEVFNVMHGFCYFLIFVCKPKILRMLWKKVNEDTTISTGDTTMTMSNSNSHKFETRKVCDKRTKSTGKIN